MKKLFIVIILILTMVLTSCDNNGEYVKEEVLIVDKYTATESKYIFILGIYKTYTAYYLVLENEDVEEVDREDYGKYQIGDYYTITVWKSYEELENE